MSQCDKQKHLHSLAKGGELDHPAWIFEHFLNHMHKVRVLHHTLHGCPAEP